MNNKDHAKKFLKENLELVVSEAKEKPGFKADIKINFYDIKNSIGAEVNGDKIGWSASIIKLPVMVGVLKRVLDGKLFLDSELEINHKYTLESGDYVSRLPNKSKIRLGELLFHMIINSDNEATNMLVNEVNIERLNYLCRKLGMNKTMMGHLLCSGVPRYTSDFNPDGSNVTCPNDMTILMRHIYDGNFTKLNAKLRCMCDFVLSQTHTGFFWVPRYKTKMKDGYISDFFAGSDHHEVGILENRFIFSIMMNKINPMPKGIKALVKNTSEMCREAGPEMLELSKAMLPWRAAQLFIDPEEYERKYIEPLDEKFDRNFERILTPRDIYDKLSIVAENYLRIVD